MILHPPTAFGPRLTDARGSGAWDAPRGRRKHKGLDWETAPWGLVHAPMDGLVVREAKPYRQPKGDINTGLLLEGTGAWEGWSLKLFYCSALVIGAQVRAREPIAVARPMREEYAGITPHVHLALLRGGTAFDPTPYLEKKSA